MTTMATRVLGCAIAATTLLVAHERAGAQTPGTRPGWLARQVLPISYMTPAQSAAAMARLEQIERLVLQIPEIARPEGFEVWPRFHGGTRILHPDEKYRDGDVVEYSLWLMFFAPSKEIAGEGLPCIEISVNPTLEEQHTALRDARGHAIYIELARGKPVPYATRVLGDFDPSPFNQQTVDVLLTSGGELPWRQVTRNEFYDASILFYEGKGGSELAHVRNALQKTPYEQWLEGAAERKQEREKTLKALVGIRSAAEIEEVRKQLEDTEREIRENLKKSEAEDRVANQKAVEMHGGGSDSMRAERNRMSAAERRMPALIAAASEGIDIGATGRALTDRDGPEVERVLTPVNDFWRARRSQDEVRAINVRLKAHLTCSNPAVKRALWQVYQKLDWAALNRMLAVPRTP